MELANISGLTELAVGGVPVAIFVFVVVEALKWSGLLKTSTAQRTGVLVTSVIGGLTWAAADLFPQLQPYATVAFVSIVGMSVSTLAYEGISRVASRRNKE